MVGIGIKCGNMSEIFSIILIGFCSFITAQKFPEKFEQNGKFGIKYQGKIVLSAIYDEIYTSPVMVAKKGNERTIFDDKMRILFNNSEIKLLRYLDDFTKMQIITDKNELFSFDEDGIITNQLRINPNETIQEKQSECCYIYSHEYSISKNKILQEQRWSPFTFDYAKYGKKIRFLNNKKKLEIEYLVSKRDSIDIVFDENIYFKPLDEYYIVSKVNGKYGVYDFRNEQIIIPYEYEKIIPYRNHLIIKQNDLFTFYPNKNLKPKYKKLKSFVGNFARFKLQDGKKGWVDRKGNEYFDE